MLQFVHVYLPGKTLEGGTLRINAQRHTTGLQLLGDEFVHFLCAAFSGDGRIKDEINTISLGHYSGVNRVV